MAIQKQTGPPVQALPSRDPKKIKGGKGKAGGPRHITGSTPQPAAGKPSFITGGPLRGQQINQLPTQLLQLLQQVIGGVGGGGPRSITWPPLQGGGGGNMRFTPGGPTRPGGPQMGPGGGPPLPGPPPRWGGPPPPVFSGPMGPPTNPDFWKNPPPGGWTEPGNTWGPGGLVPGGLTPGGGPQAPFAGIPWGPNPPLEAGNTRGGPYPDPTRNTQPAPPWVDPFGRGPGGGFRGF